MLRKLSVSASSAITTRRNKLFPHHQPSLPSPSSSHALKTWKSTCALSNLVDIGHSLSRAVQRNLDHHSSMISSASDASIPINAMQGKRCRCAIATHRVRARRWCTRPNVEVTSFSSISVIGMISLHSLLDSKQTRSQYLINPIPGMPGSPSFRYIVLHLLILGIMDESSKPVVNILCIGKCLLRILFKCYLLTTWSQTVVAFVVFQHY